MATKTRQIAPLQIPFKEFMPGQLIVSSQFNDDMIDIEDKVNEQIVEFNKLSTEFSAHTDDFNNPHGVTAEQVGSYTTTEVDEFITDLKQGEFDDNAVTNRVLADGCVETRNLKVNCVTAAKLDPLVGSQINISSNTAITERYTKTETDALIKEKVGNGTYSKEELDAKFQEVQAGQIVDSTITVNKLASDVGKQLNISANANIKNRYTKTEVDALIKSVTFPRDWGSITEEV